MSLSIQIAGSTFTKQVSSLSLPNRTGLVLEMFPRVDKASSIINYANPAVPLLQVSSVLSIANTTPGSGGTNGTFTWTASGGGGTGATGSFTVAGGVITGTPTVTNGGRDYTSPPTINFSASAGLTGAVLTATLATPTYNANGVVLRGAVSNLNGAGFDTGITPSADATFIMIHRPQVLISNGALQAAGGTNGQASGNNFGFRQFGSNVHFHGGDGINNPTSLRTTPAAGTIMFNTGRLIPNSFPLFSHYTAGVRTDIASAVASAAPVSKQYLCGPSLGWTAASQTEVHYFAIFNRSLTNAELDAANVSLKALFAYRGVTLP